MTIHSERQTGLGRGLAALIPQRSPAARRDARSRSTRIRAQPAPAAPAVRRGPSSRRSPRASASTASSSRSSSPRPSTATSSSRASAGFRAARLAGLERIPAVIRQLADRDQLELALVENLQRADLGPIEEAPPIRPLIDEFGLTHEDDRRAASAGPSRRSRTRCACSISTRRVQTPLVDGRSDARATPARSAGLPVEQQARVAGTVIEQELSVRQTEELVRRLREPTPPATPRASRGTARSGPRARRGRPAAPLGTKVTLARSRKGGRIIIEFYSDEELGQLYDRLIGGAA